MAIVATSSNLKLNVIRFKKGEDIFNQIKEVAYKIGIKSAFFFGIGTFQKLKIAYYNQKTLKYEEAEFNREVEITSLIGDISLDGNEIFIHCHVTISDKDMNAHGGHLLPGSIIFAGEALIIEISDIELKRKFDSETGLRILES